MTNRLAVLAAALVAALASAPAGLRGQANTDIIRGRVTGPDSQPISGARVTATSYQGNIPKTTDTDKNGRFQLIFVNGEGDYWIEINKIGYTRRRFEVRKIGDEQVILADARLASTIVTLDAVNITGDNRALVNRNAPPADVSGGDRSLGTSSVAVPPDQAGNLAAMASTTPGIQRIPGMDGQADMFSAFGLGGDQNNTTFNGLGSGVSALPPDAQVRVSFSQFPADVSRGGFSGAQINVMSIPGSNFSFRGLSGYGTTPEMQWTDAGADSAGQKSTTLRFGGSLRGPLRMDKAFYNASYSAQRTFADMLHLLNTSPLGLEAAGVAADSATRLIGILGAKGVPASIDRQPRSRATDNVNWQANVDLSPSASGAGHSLTLGMFGGHVHVQPTGGAGASTITRTPAQVGEASIWSNSASLLHSMYFGFGVLSQTTLGFSLQTQDASPVMDYPTGMVRVASRMPDGTTSIRNLSFGGGNAPSSTSNFAAQLTNQLQWFSANNKHTIKVVSSVSREHNTSAVNAGYGTFTFNSLADLEAGRPASYMRILSPIEFPADQMTAGLSVGDAWRPTTKVQVQYGVRADANRFLFRPTYNSAVESAFGIRNDFVPNRINFSPRAGLQWTYGTAPTIAYAPGVARPPLAVVHAVAGIFQNVGPAGLISSAAAQTGLPSSLQSITCIGAAAPTPNWNLFNTNPEAAPTTCADGSSGTVFSTAAPSVVSFDRSFVQPRSFRTAADWSGPVLDNRFVLGVQGVSSWNMNQMGTVDVNLDTLPGFSLASEGGRPVFVGPTAIVPSTGTVAITDSRRVPAFRSVLANRSDLRSLSTQLVVKISPVTTNKYLRWDFSYSLLNVRDQFNGFGGSNTVGNPFTRQWGPHTAAGKHSINVNWSSFPIADLVYVSAGVTLRSGALFTPMIAGDVNGDGNMNDRAFIFDPASTADATLADGMRSLLNSGAPAARECLAKQLGRLSGRATCHAPWVTTANLALRLNAQKARLPKRASVSLNFTNPLAIADLVLHGDGKTRGWGQDIAPDQNLLFVRGFDPATRQYRYTVNERFGSTRPQQSASRSAAFVSLNVGVDIGFTRERQLLTQRLSAGRTRPGSKQTSQNLKAFGTSSIPNPMAMILQQPDSLKLTRKQADSLATLSTRLARIADSIWTPAAKALEAIPERFDHSDAYKEYVRAREQTMDFLIGIAPDVRGLLTAEQKRKLPSIILNYLDDRVLHFLRSSSAGDGGAFFIIR